MAVCSYGNKAGYSTGVEFAEVQPRRALLYSGCGSVFCLLPMPLSLVS